MGRKKLSSVVTGTDEGADPTPCAPVLSETVKKVLKKGVTEAWFHQGVVLKVEKNSAGLNNVNVNNPSYKDLSLSLTEDHGFIQVVSSKMPNKKYFVPMANIRYFVEEE